MHTLLRVPDETKRIHLLVFFCDYLVAKAAIVV
jgi:hypothetical protein